MVHASAVEVAGGCLAGAFAEEPAEVFAADAEAQGDRLRVERLERVMEEVVDGAFDGGLPAVAGGVDEVDHGHDEGVGARGELGGGCGAAGLGEALEVGEVAVQAALTGHMVFSTLHTTAAPSALTRLIDMGLKPFLVASSIQAVLGQRLVRILCEHCKVPDTEPSRKMMALCGMTDSDLEGQTIYKPEGCTRCGGTGYRGRRGVYELMFMNSELRELAFNRAQVSKIRAAAVASGMRTLLGDGKLKILDGQTTLEEIARIAQVEGTVELEDDDLAA